MGGEKMLLQTIQAKLSPFSYNNMQQPIENQFITELLAKFDQDESEATRDALDRLLTTPDRRPDYLRAFNLLLSCKHSPNRQRRDVAAIARLIADSPLFTLLETLINEEVEAGSSTGPHSITLETTKLIANLCNQNPHLIDNILASAPVVLPRLLELYSCEKTLSEEGESICAVLHFLHTISLKETALREERVGPCLEAFLRCLLTHDKFTPFISHKKFQNFVGALFKLQANAAFATGPIYGSLVRSARSLNQEYKQLGELYRATVDKTLDSQHLLLTPLDVHPAPLAERTAVTGRAGFADKKLIAIMKLFERARKTVLAKLSAFNFVGLLKIFVKIAIIRPVALLGQPVENKLLVTIINDLMGEIGEHRDLLAQHGLLGQKEKQPEGPGIAEELDDQEGEILPPVEEEKLGFTSSQVEKFRAESSSFERIEALSKHFSSSLFKVIKNSIEILEVSFGVMRLGEGEGEALRETYLFLIGIHTVRLERILCWMLKVLPAAELQRQSYYRDIVGALLKIQPYYFEAALEAEHRAITEEIGKMEDVSAESEGSVMRYIMETIDEESVKSCIHSKLIQKINIYSTLYEAVLKFVYHLIEEEDVMRENMNNFVHVFIAIIRENYLNQIGKCSKINFRQVLALRLSLRVVSDLFHNNVSPSTEDQIKNRAKLYKYCTLIREDESGNDLFSFLGDIINNIQKHEFEKTVELLDTMENREEVIKSIFIKLLVQRAKSYVNSVTLAHLSRASVHIADQPLEQIKAYYQTMYYGYFSYIHCMSQFVMKICATHKFTFFKEEIVGTVLDRTLDYSIFVEQDCSSDEVGEWEGELMKKMKRYIDEQVERLLSWALANSHCYLHRLPLLVRKIVHFEKRELLNIPEEDAIAMQEQKLHVEAFLERVSEGLSAVSWVLTGKKLDLKIRMRKKVRGGEVGEAREVQRLTNFVVMVGELAKLLTDHECFEPHQQRIHPNYLYSILGLIREVLLGPAAEELFSSQADQLIHSSLWLIDKYLHYYQHLQDFTKSRKTELRRQSKAKIKRGKAEQREQERKENLQRNGQESTQGKKRQRRRKKRCRRGQGDEAKTLSRNGSKANLLEQSQVKSNPKTKTPRREEAGEITFQRRLREYVGFICEWLGSSGAVVRNDTMAYLLNFISTHMRRSIIQSPPYASFQLSLGELIGPLLQVRVAAGKVPGYHLSLCKLALQLFDENHIKVDYELAIKRYLFERADGEVGFREFVEMLRENFKEISPSTAALVEIVCTPGERGEQTSRIPFNRSKYEELLHSKDRKYKFTVQAKEGVELHLVNTRSDNPTIKRKSSGPAEERPVKASEYCPEGELHIFVEQAITHSVRRLFAELDRCFVSEAFENELNYQTKMEPFTIRSVLQTLQYLVRESPSLGPFIAKFKCRRIILAALANEKLTNRNRVTAFAMKLLTGSPHCYEAMPQVGYLSVLLRLFSPLVVNAISGLIFELCLDSTPLVQAGEGRTGSKALYLPFSSVVRRKVVEEVENVLFERVELPWLFRKLCLLSLVTVLANIREMAKLFLENGFIPKIYRGLERLKAELGNSCLQHRQERLGGSYVTRVMTPFYFAPLAILQELNISFHYNKKLSKTAPRVSIITVLSRASINAQLIPRDALKGYKFKLDWPYHLKNDLNILEANEEDAEVYAEDASSDSQSNSESYQSLDSLDNSSFMRYSEFEEQMAHEDDGYQSYMSLDEPQGLLNEEWDYSSHGIGEPPMGEEYPHEQDHIIEIEDGEDGVGEYIDEIDDEGQHHSSDGDENSEEGDIDEYMENEAAEDEDNGDIGESLIDGLDELVSVSGESELFPREGQRQEFSINNLNEEEYYSNVSALLNFEKVESIPRINKMEKRQVHLLRFFLQLQVLNKRKEYNLRSGRLLSPHEEKEEKLLEENLELRAAFEQDEVVRQAEFIEYDQIYRYDHYHKETPTLADDIDKHFLDHLEVFRSNYRRRNGFIAAHNSLIEIVPGWNITEVHDEHPDPDHPMFIDDSAHPPESHAHDPEEESNSHLQIASEEEGGEVNMGEEAMGEEVSDQQHIANIQAMLQNSSLNMTYREFMRLDPEIQHDILLNIAEQEAVPGNSPPSLSLTPPFPRLEIPSQGELGEELVEEREPPSHSPSEAMVDESEPANLPVQEIVPQPPLQEEMVEESEVRQPEADQEVHEVYRKMSLEHSKKITKDVIEALNKDGRNNGKFYELEEGELETLLEVFFLTSEIEHSKYPYPLVETLCINTHNLQRVISNLVALLHITPPRFTHPGAHRLLHVPRCDSPEEQLLSYSDKVYPGLALKILHLLTHLTRNYSIAMAFLRVNGEVCGSLKGWEGLEQSALSSFEMLVLLLGERTIAQSPMVLSFLIGVLDNVTMHYFYKNVHRIVEEAAEAAEEGVRLGEGSVYLLGELLQSDFVGENLPIVSRIIMRLSVEPENLQKFMKYLEELVRLLTDQALEEVARSQQREDAHGRLKIVDLMSIFYEMVRAFETYPTSLQRHLQVLSALRAIVEYDQLQLLCERALKTLFEQGGRDIYQRIGEVVDCFFVLYEIALITGARSTRPPLPPNDHNHIAELGTVGLAQLRRSQMGAEEEVVLGKFNLTQLWKESVNHPNFKVYVNNNIRRKMADKVHSRRASLFDMPIIRIAASTPHLLSFDNKHSLFKAELKRLRGKEKGETIHIRLKREQVFEASFEQFMTRGAEKLRGKLKVEFEGEEGEDAGGVTREWFQLLSREMFNPNYGLFRAGSGGHTYHPSSTSYVNQKHLEFFKFIGRITGKALYDGYLLDAYFTPAFYKHILHLPITYQDMEQEDYEYFKSLVWILENSPIQDYLDLTFTYDCDHFGELRTKDLLPNGATIPVTDVNKLDYVQLIAYAKMATNVKAQLEAFLTGLHELIPHRLLSIFTQKELEIMISGRPTIDIEDLRCNSELVNYMKNDPIIVWLFEVLEAFDMELRTAFIQFVTGSSRVPVEGFKDLRGMNGVQRFNIHRDYQEDRLPRAHTCFNQLDLPSYKTKEILIEKLMYAITEGKEGFGMI